MSEKIQPSHIEREAYVYIRQSSMQQVRTRLEGQRRQYDLRERAQALGFQRVVVIDEDMGRSGTGSVERPGFGRLLTAVCSGRVGAVLALEASRLARNNRDWHHLIDLCAMAGTLVVDHDGIYDPGLLNDRLLLGLKGTMSEFEISLLRQRAMEARRQKVGRGLVLTKFPSVMSAPKTKASRRHRTVRFRKPSRASSASFASWAVCAKFCFGIATRNC